jgi:hypothetical protein
MNGVAASMKISSIETFHQNNYLALVKVRTEDGLEGWGQTSAFLADQSVPALHDQVAPWFLGSDPWDVAAVVDRCVRREYKFYGTVLYRALCGIETAIWDLLGKSVGRPVYQLLGGTVRTTIDVYGSSMRRDITPEDEAERLQGLVDAGTFTGFKIRVGAVMGQDADARRAAQPRSSRTFGRSSVTRSVCVLTPTVVTPPRRRSASAESSRPMATTTSRSPAPIRSSRRRRRLPMPWTFRSPAANRIRASSSSIA